MVERAHREAPPLRRSLSARLLILTATFVLLGEVLIYVPSIARYRLVYLQERIAAAHLATLTLEAAPDGMVPPTLERELLAHARVRAIALHRPRARYKMLGESPPIAASYDLAQAGPALLIYDAFVTLAQGHPRIIRVTGPAEMEPGTTVEVTLSERQLREEMVGYSWRILNLSVVLSLIVAFLVFFTIYRLMVQPMRRLTARMVAFRQAPEDPAQVIQPEARGDEIGVAQHELADMQHELRQALGQKNRLAALGAAVGKINHDLRNILSTAVLISDSLAASDDPKVRRQAIQLFKAVDRAAKICSQTLNFARYDAPSLQRRRFSLRKLVDDVGSVLPHQVEHPVRWINDVENGLAVAGDRDQLFRVLMNLGTNAVEALSAGGEIRVAAARGEAATEIRIADSGPGLSEKARAHLFEPFSGSGRAGGTGLGLAIARDVMRGHGGDILLEKSDASGTVFRLILPDDKGTA